MTNSFYGDPQDSPDLDAGDTLALLIGRYVTNIETGTFEMNDWMEDCEKPRRSSPSTMARSFWP